MAGLMKDVGASYGCHNSADGGAWSAESAAQPSPPPFTRTRMTSDSQPVGESAGVRKIEIGAGHKGGPIISPRASEIANRVTPRCPWPLIRER